MISVGKDEYSQGMLEKNWDNCFGKLFDIIC